MNYVFLCQLVKKGGREREIEVNEWDLEREVTTIGWIYHSDKRNHSKCKMYENPT